LAHSDEQSDGPAHFTIAFGRRPTMIGFVRRVVTNFYDEVMHRHGSQRDPWSSRLALAAHELLENAVVYGSGDDASFCIAIDADPRDMPASGHVVRMTTRNRATPEQRETVRRRLEAIGHAEDILAFYVALMLESARRSDGSGLGLARIRVEAEMAVSCVVDGETLEITAQAYIDRDAARMSAHIDS
jgi:hypothetical protein